MFFLFPKCSLTKTDPEILFPTLGTTQFKCYPRAAKQQFILVLAEGKPEARAEGKI